MSHERGHVERLTEELHNQWQRSAEAIAGEELSAMDQSWEKAVEYRLGNFGGKFLSPDDIANTVDIFYGNVEDSLQKASSDEIIDRDRLIQETKDVEKIDPLLAQAVQTSGEFLLKVQQELPQIPPVFTRIFIPARRRVITERVSHIPVFSSPLKKSA